MPLLSQRFSDRREAGRQLARKLMGLRDKPGVVVLALPRGGVPVAAEIAAALGVPLDVFVVRKLGVPGHPELAMGAVASGGVRVINTHVLSEYMIPRSALEMVTAKERDEVGRREAEYRGRKPFPDLRGATVVVGADRKATRAPMVPAVRALTEQPATRLVVAAPRIAASTQSQLLTEADEVVSVAVPEHFLAVGVWYDDFQQTTDAEVIRLLDTTPAAGKEATLRGAPYLRA